METSIMTPLICYSVDNLENFSFKDYLFEGYEFKSLAKGFKFNILIIKKLKEQFKDKDLSLHSQLSRIFSCNDQELPEFSNAELNLLKTEIITSKLIGIKQINFHMKETKLTKEEINRFNEIVNFAKENNIEMIYENHVCSEKVILDILEAFPEINFCLDLGHLNVAMHKKKFNMDLEEFIEKVKSRLVHIHAHNNYGDKDSHKSLDEGNFPWKKVLSKLKNQNLRKIIIENPNQEDSIKSKMLLEKYFKEKHL